MLSTLLSQLQTYFSKYFVVGFFSPMLAFAFLNGSVGYVVFDPWRNWADANILNATVAGGAFLTTSLVVAIVLAAYVLSALSTFLRRQLEGKWWGGFGTWFIPAQNRRRLQLVGARDEAFKEMADLAHTGDWETLMREAQTEGMAKHPGVALRAGDPDDLENGLVALETKRQRYEIVKAGELKALADLIGDRSRTCDIRESPTLVAQQARLLALIDYATDDYSAEGVRGRHARLQNELNSNFGAQDVAPTKMGNVANTIQSYVMRRYRCNLETVWSNLLKIVQENDKAQAALQETKTQLDFLVACCWLTLLSGAIWAVIFLWIAPSRLGFIVAALGGPLAAYLWYRAAAEQYRTFADIAMTSFDTFRLDLLEQMRLGRPTDVEQERYMWAMYDKLTTFGEDKNFRYAPPRAPQTQNH